ncbi:hypothetical protein [Sphingopyxis sp. YF1]|uniref:hypothetical protein n=1 Tax=Sphingopyxis sp. YF1 TaxID=2482763 RepID=UPI001F62544E|nr:hypothetical protein [Sphingopyxis sp. YF1]
MGEILSASIEVIVNAFLQDKVDRGLRRYFWLRVAGLALLAIIVGLAAGFALREFV